MKIEDLLLLPSLAPRPASSGHRQGDFARCLKEALGGPPASAAGGAPGLGAPGEVTPVAPTPERLSSLVEPALDRLEAFARGLENPGTSLRDLAPLARELEEDSRRLAALSQALTGASPLRPLVEEAAALAYVESLKFQRGDYL